MKAVKALINDTLGSTSTKFEVYLDKILIPTPVSRKSGRGPREPPTPPLLIITAPGADSLQFIVSLNATRPDINLTLVSLGQGQVCCNESHLNIRELY